MLEVTFKNLTLTLVRRVRSLSLIDPQRVLVVGGLMGFLKYNLSTEQIMRGLRCIQNVYYRIVVLRTGQAPDVFSIGGLDA